VCLFMGKGNKMADLVPCEHFSCHCINTQQVSDQISHPSLIPGRGNYQVFSARLKKPKRFALNSIKLTFLLYNNTTIRY